MDGGASLVIKPFWYDRNSLQAGGLFAAATIPPHAMTMRTTYTVPAGRAALVSSIVLAALRAAAPATLNEFAFQALVYPFGAGPHNIVYTRIALAAQWDSYNEFTGFSLLLSVGDRFELYTEDSSIGGSYNISTGFAITEFDA